MRIRGRAIFKRDFKPREPFPECVPAGTEGNIVGMPPHAIVMQVPIGDAPFQGAEGGAMCCVRVDERDASSALDIISSAGSDGSSNAAD